MRQVLRMLRPWQWVKNIFVFLPIFFNGSLFKGEKLMESLIVFFAFSFAASGIYCLNDVVDKERDSRHPLKKNRPVASGAVSTRTALFFMILLFFLSMTTCMLLGLCDSDRPLFSAAQMIIALYFVMNCLYCLFLKNMVIVDVFIIAVGFVLRIVAGGKATDIDPTEWLVLMTFLIALFLALAKRRDDVILYLASGVAPRKDTGRYNLEFIDQLLTLTSTMTIMCYVMYCVSEQTIINFGTRYVYLTAVFVLAGQARYLQRVLVYNDSGNPTRILLHDRFLQLCILAWVLSFVIIIYVI